jgi:hypothetical protein
MTPNDAQIDLLLRSHAGQTHAEQAPAGQAKRNSATQHLDADELNAFAEGSLPAAARSRYVSHLADCDDCRKVASQLAITSGAVVAAEATTVADSRGYSWWKRLSGFFSPLTLRYAAFAVVLVAVVGVVFLVTRRPRESALIAQRESADQQQVSAVKPINEGASQSSPEPRQALADRQLPAAQPSQSSDQLSKLEQSKTGDAASPPKPAKETETTSSPALAAKKAAEPGESLPSYAPPPPAETVRVEDRSREQQNIGAVASVSGPRKSEQQVATKPQIINGGRAGAGKDVQYEDDNRRGTVNQAPASRGRADEKLKGPRREVDNVAANNRNANESRGNATKTQAAADSNRESAEEKAPETRSVGGRKFKHQGNAWVDAKFKSSMSLKSISRGSSEFDALDSGLRSIAQQLSGEVIVVWKSKAYLIR